MFNLSKAQIAFERPVCLRSNLGLICSFSGVAYDAKNVQLRPNGCDFTIGNNHFRDVDMEAKGIQVILTNENQAKN